MIKKAIKTINQGIKQKFKPAMAMLMMLTMLFGSMPIEIIASTVSSPANTTETTIMMNGQEIALNADGSFEIPQTNVTIEHSYPQEQSELSNLSGEAISSRIAEAIESGYYSDDEPIYLGDGLFYYDGVAVVINARGSFVVYGEPNGEVDTSVFIGLAEPITVTVQDIIDIVGLERLAQLSSSSHLYVDGRLIERSSADIQAIMPLSTGSLTGTQLQLGTSMIEDIEGGFQNTVSYAIAGRSGVVDARRYRVLINGVWYEAYCIDPHLSGPGQAGSQPYVVVATDNIFRDILRYGFPGNPAMNHSVAYNAYITRVAVAIRNWAPHAVAAGNVDAYFSGDPIVIGSALQLLRNENYQPAFHAQGLYRRVTINGMHPYHESMGELQGGMVVSPVLTLTHLASNRDALGGNVPVSFTSIPAGVQIWGATGTTPINTDNITSDLQFRIAAPEGSDFPVQVDIEGVNNAYAETVWTANFPSNPAGFQDIVFYIPRVFVSAVMRPDDTGDNGGCGDNGGGGDNGPPPPSPPPPAEPSSVTIQKIDALSRDNIPGAMMRPIGMSANYVTLPDGQSISFNNTGIQLMQVLTAGATTATPGAVTSTVEDGVWVLEGLPYGFYMVYEYRAPDGYSLLPAHTARGFWLAPPNVQVDMTMPEVDISVNADQESVTVDVTVGGITAGDGGGGDPEAGWYFDFSLNIPSDDMPLPDFEIIESPVAHSILITFENYPFSEIIAYKHDRITGEPLAGAHIRIQGVRPDRT